MSDRSREKETTALTSVRTVRSRARTALVELERGNSKHDGEWTYDVRFLDQDYEAMRAALETVLELLEPWRKGGPRKK